MVFWEFLSPHLDCSTQNASKLCSYIAMFRSIHNPSFLINVRDFVLKFLSKSNYIQRGFFQNALRNFEHHSWMWVECVVSLGLRKTFLSTEDIKDFYLTAINLFFVFNTFFSVTHSTLVILPEYNLEKYKSQLYHTMDSWISRTRRIIMKYIEWTCTNKHKNPREILWKRSKNKNFVQRNFSQGLHHSSYMKTSKHALFSSHTNNNFLRKSTIENSTFLSQLV